jgi:hypothetical protein
LNIRPIDLIGFAGEPLYRFSSKLITPKLNADALPFFYPAPEINSYPNDFCIFRI